MRVNGNFFCVEFYCQCQITWKCRTKNSLKDTSANSQYSLRNNHSSIFNWDIILVYCGGCVYSSWDNTEELLFIITSSIKLVACSVPQMST